NRGSKMIFLSSSQHETYKVYHYRVRSFKQIELDYDDKELQLHDFHVDGLKRANCACCKNVRIIYRASTQTFYCYYSRVDAELLSWFTVSWGTQRIPGLHELLTRQGNYLVNVRRLKPNCLIYQLDNSLSLVGV